MEQLIEELKKQNLFMKEELIKSREERTELVKIMSELLVEVKNLKKLGEHYKAFHK